jgi:nicotinate-nucleotide adenylyltransferase
VLQSSGPRRRVGLFGGTFDPPHVGHLVTAVNVRHELDLDVVILMVANIPWQKQAVREVEAADDRLAMVRAAVDGVTGLEAGDTEIRSGGPSFTADTLAELQREDPDAEFFTIVGADAANDLLTWERVDEVVDRSQLVVVDRPGSALALPALPGTAEWMRVEVPHLEVSSTDLRSRVVDGRPLEFLIPPGVIDVITQRGLYRGGGG